MKSPFIPSRLALNETITFDAQASADRLLDKNDVLFGKICAALDCPRSEVRIALREALRFMHLAAGNAEGRLTPSVRVDLVWHEFILCTKAYQDFCNSQFGQMVHHYPGGDVQQNESQYRRTLESYEREFGSPPVKYWCAAQSCGLCDGA